MSSRAAKKIAMAKRKREDRSRAPGEADEGILAGWKVLVGERPLGAVELGVVLGDNGTVGDGAVGAEFGLL